MPRFIWAVPHFEIKILCKVRNCSSSWKNRYYFLATIVIKIHKLFCAVFLIKFFCKPTFNILKFQFLILSGSKK